jgi:hypothetical protein
MAVEVHSVEDGAEKVARELEAGSVSGGTWSVLGEPTAGKSAVLESLHERFAASDWIQPILVTPPPRANDAAHAALIDLAEGLDLKEQALDVIRDPTATWEEKLRRVRHALGHERRFVLLLDQPDAWAPSETYFTSFVHDIWNLVFNHVGISTVTAGPAPIPVKRRREFYLAPVSDPRAVLDAIDAPSLAAAKYHVQDRFGASLPSISPLQIRLLVAIAALSEPDADRIDASAVDHRAALVDILVNLVDDDSPPLRDVWLHLSAVREPFAHDLLGLVKWRELTHRDAAIVKQCLLFPRRGGLLLHESLRAINQLLDYDKTAVHGLLAKYYRHRFDDPEAQVPARLRDSVEAFHHASNAGIFELETYKPFFVDQLNILGYHLSVDEQDPATAAEVFHVALGWDPVNAYAAHYRAVNLDRQVGIPGAVVDPEEVERLYRLAVDQQPDHPWFRSRLINFLIARSQIDEAWLAWLEAAECFGSDPSESVFNGLHLHVARNLLYRGEFRHAQTVLRALPPEVANEPRFRAIRDRLWALREAEEHGSYVPAIYLKPEWWRHPNKLRNTGLKRWLAAKVVGASSDEVELDVADITPGAPPEYGHLDLPLETLRGWWRESADVSTLEPGEFLEIGFYDEDGQRVDAVRHPRLRWDDWTYPTENDPDRYLRAAS